MVADYSVYKVSYLVVFCLVCYEMPSYNRCFLVDRPVKGASRELLLNTAFIYM